ncbi:MAG: elongation factor G [Candidatus Saelkia tenebricola]|nr:elongation factor G [Candidatus Saelkia tenebricola]
MKKIRNVALVGHSAAGKTSLVEAMLFKTGAINRIGKAEDGNTTSDFAPDETKRRISINTSVLNFIQEGYLVNILDTPGYADFAGEVLSALRAVDAVILTISAASGVEVGTERSFEYAKEMNLPVIIFVNRCDKENTNIEKTLSEIKDRFGDNCIPFSLPDTMGPDISSVYSIFESDKAPESIKSEIDGYYKSIVDFAAEADDAILERYLEGEELTAEEVANGLESAIRDRKLIPVYFGSALKDQLGVESLLKGIINFLPAPDEMGPYKSGNVDNEEVLERSASIDSPFSGLIFKTIYDPYVGQLTIFRILSGTLNADTGFYNSTKSTKERIGKIFKLQGKEQAQIALAAAGDIVAVAKLKETQTTDTICDEKQRIVYSSIDYPESPVCFSIKPKAREDEEKIMEALHKLSFEDPTFKVSRGEQTKELLIYGLGDLHLDIMVDRLKERFGVDVELDTPKVPYRETVTKASSAQGRYKRQTGGRGQYGDVWLKLEPLERDKGFEFVDAVVGGVVPKQYIPAAEKGVKKTMTEGVLAGCPVVDVRVTIYDGSYHSVDSSDMAFQIAGSMSFRNAAVDAGMVLLEPLMDVEVVIPDEYMGQVSGDINSKRGRIAGVEAKGGMETVKVQVPLAEMFKYGSELRSITGGRGYYIMRFSHYEIVPQRIADKIIKEAQSDKKEE